MDAVYSIASAKCLLDQNNGSDKLFIKEFNNSLHLHRMVEHHSTGQSEQESVLGSVGYMLINSFLRAESHGVMNPSPASTHMKFNRIYYIAQDGSAHVLHICGPSHLLRFCLNIKLFSSSNALW